MNYEPLMNNTMEEGYILALDQGTTSSRAIIFDHKGQIRSVAQKEFTQIFPKPGWVEHDPNEIWSTQAGVAAEATTKMGINGKNIRSIGITNQRETTIVWNRETGLPVYNAIVWQDRRTSDYCNQLKNEGYTDLIRSKTGLIIDSYFSASKINWILNNVDGAKELANDGKLAFGTVDSWLIWKFTRGKVHVTDVTNASRTMLYNIRTQQWDEELLKIFEIPASMLPEVKQSSEVYGETDTTIFASKVPIAGIAGDQQAALFGQMCIDKAMVKNTYGTGCFMLMNIGDTFIESKNNLLTTIEIVIMRMKAAYLLGEQWCNGCATGLV
jgi:glycerol kinase